MYSKAVCHRELLWDRSEAERFRVYMDEIVRVAEATRRKGEVGETENSGESEVDKPNNSAAESEGELSTELLFTLPHIIP